LVSTRSIIGGENPRRRAAAQGHRVPSIGTETLDLRLANERTLIVANAPRRKLSKRGRSHVMLMLALMYDLHGTERVLRRNLPRPAQLKARMLQGKTVGIVGLGRIGRGVIQRLAGWGVRIPRLRSARGSRHDRRRHADRDARRAAGGKRHRIPCTRRRRRARGRSSAGVTGPDAAHGLSSQHRERCVGGRSRVQAALRDGTIAGAALDAFEVEPLPPGSGLRVLDNAILTPHMVAHTAELFSSFAPAAWRT